MKRFHIALAVADLDASIEDYSTRLGQPPQVVVDGVYALWRTELLNFSICRQPEQAGSLCRMGFVDDDTRGVTRDTDVNGIPWERGSPRLRTTCAWRPRTACRATRPATKN